MLKIAWIKIENLKEDCITDRPPLISFSLESDREGEALNNAVITCGNWKKETTDQINNIYDGELVPFHSYKVHVKAVGISGEIAESEAEFKTGRMDTPWEAKWITDLSYDYPNKVSPIPMTFRRHFTIDKKIRTAWINASALGVYEILINGKKAGSDYFAPGLTSYENQIQYQTYDIKEQLQTKNTLTAVVAGGWAAGSFNYVRKNKISADRQAFLCELHIEYEDESHEVIASDESFEVTLDGNYRMAEWYDGEVYDATVNLEQSSWKQVDITHPRSNPKLIAQYGAPVRAQEVRNPVSHTVMEDGRILYDFGQNFAGVISANIVGEKGRKITFRHAEVLIDGELFVKSLRTAKAEAVYICEEGEQHYSPRLTYMGFRYVEVSGVAADKITLQAMVLHSQIEETGSFTCSNSLINKLQSNIRWGGKSNFVDIPTDCPQRDERQGWTGDIAVFAQTACYNFDMSRFFDKWLLDMRAEQGNGGGIPMVVPKAGDSWPCLANSCWGDSCILVPWAEYLARGNKRLLEEQYPAIKKFLKAAKWWSSFLCVSPNKKHIWKLPFHFGDWCAPEETARQWMAKGKWVGTAYFSNSCMIASKIASIIGKEEDARYYLSLRNSINRAYREVFTDKKGTLKKEFQTAYVLPLYFQMAEPEELKKMAQNLLRLVEEAGNHLTTGFTGTPYLLFALSDNGFVKEAYDLLLQESCPSWLYEVKAGATTIWERWDALRPDGTVNIGELTGNKKDEDSAGGMVSFNHYANGAVGDWLYRRIAGIEAISGGYKEFRIAPILGGNLTSARGSILTPYGQIVSQWHIEDRIFHIQVEIPVSTHGSIVLPNGERKELESGRYQLSCVI